MSHEVRAKVPPAPYTPSAPERKAHEATHCPYRAWCSDCVAGKTPERRHLTGKANPEKAPCIELDYNFGSDKSDDPEHKVTMLVACDSVHQSLVSLSLIHISEPTRLV